MPTSPLFSPRLRRRGRLTTVTSAVAVAVLVGLGGCTVSGDGEEQPTEVPGVGGSTTAGASPDPRPTEAGDGPDADELSAAVLALAAEQPDPLAGQTLEVRGQSGGAPVTVTVEVLELRRSTGSTLLTLQMSSPEPGTKIENNALDTDRNSEFFDRFGLEDTTNGVRYLPLSWNRGAVGEPETPDGPVDSCVCGYRASNFTLGPDPVVMDFLYGPLPEGLTSVTLTAPDGLSVPDLPVAPAAR